MNQQDVFTKAVTHLLRQGVQSRTEGGGFCRYRGANGTMCAAGPFLTDEGAEEYEGHSIEAIPGRYFIEGASEHTGILRELQRIHDNDPPETWRKKLRAYAAARDFKMPKVEGAVL